MSVFVGLYRPYFKETVQLSADKNVFLTLDLLIVSLGNTKERSLLELKYIKIPFTHLINVIMNFRKSKGHTNRINIVFSIEKQ